MSVAPEIIRGIFLKARGRERRPERLKVAGDGVAERGGVGVTDFPRFSVCASVASLRKCGPNRCA